MVLSKVVTMQFPVNSLQLINYSVASYNYYNIFLPLLNSDSQLGTEITFVKTNGVVNSNAASTPGKLFVGSQSANNIYVTAGIGNPNFNTSNFIVFNETINFIAIKLVSGVYGWFVNGAN